jgi:hypothetical protein
MQMDEVLVMDSSLRTTPLERDASPSQSVIAQAEQKEDLLRQLSKISKQAEQMYVPPFAADPDTIVD